MNATQEKLSTVGAIADALNVKVHRVVYVVGKLGIIPECRAGRLRVFSDSQVEQIRHELAARPGGVETAALDPTAGAECR